MNKIYVTGHRNPDLDSICSAYAYALLKNSEGENAAYEAVVSSRESEHVAKQLAIVGLKPLPCITDIRPKVSDVMMNSEGFDRDNPIYDLVRTYTTEKPSVVPIYDEESFQGLLSVEDITSWFLRDNSVENPSYDITIDNICHVIPGKVIRQGRNTHLFGTTILTGASDYADFVRLVDNHKSGILITGMREGHITYAIEKQLPAIIVSDMDEEDSFDFSGYEGFVYMTPLTTFEVIRRIRMTQSIGSLMGEQMQPVQAEDLFEEVKEEFLSSHIRGIAVMDGDEYCGFVTRRSFLETPENHVVLVDHNEADQSVKGLETAVIDEIIDHHRLNALKTDLPIYINVRPVGSTCTIVLDEYMKKGMKLDELCARALLAGIISDTLILCSPTTTKYDIDAAQCLSDYLGISLNEFGEELLSVSGKLADAEPEKIISSDMKKYEENGIRFGIAQCEAVTLEDVNEYKEEYLATLEQKKKDEGLDWMLLMITDVLKKDSILLSTQHRLEKKLSYEMLEEGLYFLPQIMSRKKQLLPELLHIME